MDKSNLIKLFEKLISFKSITPSDSGAFEFIKSYLSDFEAIQIDKEGIKNLFLYKKFGEGVHLSFAGHIDVVPAGENWNSDPFEATFKDGYIYGRGSQDMKSGVASFIEAIKESKTFNGTLSIILTSDEEGDAKYGTIEVIKHLKEINFLPNYVIVAEPTSKEIFGDAIKVGRRGSINGIIIVNGIQGHAAYPEKSINPIHQIAPILETIAGVNLDDGDEFFAPSKLVITDIRAGMEVSNVTPANLKMMFNVRNSTKTTIKDIENFINKKFKNLNYTLSLSEGAKPFVTNKNSLIVDNLVQAIEKVTKIKPKLSTAGGTSDARFFGEFGVDTVEFGVKNDTIHSVNERTSIDEVENLYEVFKEVLKKF